MTPGGPLGVQNIEKLTLIIEKGLYNITFSLIRFRGSGSAAQAARPLQYTMHRHKERLTALRRFGPVRPMTA